jgi:hypothetical protein
MIESKRCLHRGYYLRSLTEGDWALALDALGVRYLYEPEIIAGYLPDFLLTHAGLYLEIKPTRPSAEELAKAERLFHATGVPIAIASGRPRAEIFDRRWEACGTSLRVFFGRWVELSLNDLSRLAYEAGGDLLGLKVVGAAMKRAQGEGYRQAEFKDRAKQEQANQGINAPINAIKMAEAYVPGQIERAIGRYLQRVMQRTAHKE